MDKAAKRAKVLFVLAAVIAGIWIGFFHSDGLCDLSGDSARYFLLGKALSDGHGYVEIEKPGLPVHTEYGPALPAVMAVLMKLGADSPEDFKWLMYLSLLSGTVLFFGYVAMKERPGETALSAGVLVLIAATFPFQARFANQVLSDLPYLAVSMLALAVVYSAGDEKRSAKVWFIAGLVAGISFLFRQVGLALWVGFLLGILLSPGREIKERLKLCVLVTVGFWLVAGAWLLRNYFVVGSLDPSHADKLFWAKDADPFAGTIGLTELLLRGLKGLRSYVRELGSVLFDMPSAYWSFPTALRAGAALLILVPAVYGLFSRIISRRGPLEFYFIVYVAIISLWQSHNPRYLLPILPLIVFYAAHGLSSFLSSTKWKVKAMGGAAGLLVIVNILVFAGDAGVALSSVETPGRVPCFTLKPGQRDEMKELAGTIKWGYWYQYPDMLSLTDTASYAMRWHRLQAVLIWCGKNLPDDAVIAARKPRLAAYYTGRYALQYPALLDPAALSARLEEMGVTHVFIDEVSPAVRQVIKNYAGERPDDLKVVYGLGGTYIAGFNPTP